jgi:hypothetical protein
MTVSIEAINQKFEGIHLNREFKNWCTQNLPDTFFKELSPLQRAQWLNQQRERMDLQYLWKTHSVSARNFLRTVLEADPQALHEITAHRFRRYLSRQNPNQLLATHVARGGHRISEINEVLTQYPETDNAEAKAAEALSKMYEKLKALEFFGLDIQGSLSNLNICHLLLSTLPLLTDTDEPALVRLSSFREALLKEASILHRGNRQHNTCLATELLAIVKECDALTICQDDRASGFEIGLSHGA